MARGIDAILQLLKWPVAVVVVLSIPQLLRADLQLIQSLFRPMFATFWLGVLGYIAIWWTALRQRWLGNFVPTLLHELTHGLFAVLTFHRILSLKATWSSGGEIQYVGPGNWLITVAPYFFPLAMVMAVPLSTLLPADNTMRLALLGAVLGFEVVAMARQIRPMQPDLQKIGLPFAALFIPGALLWSYGAILSLVAGGSDGMIAFLLTQGRDHLHMLRGLLP